MHWEDGVEPVYSYSQVLSSVHVSQGQWMMQLDTAQHLHVLMLHDPLLLQTG